MTLATGRLTFAAGIAVMSVVLGTAANAQSDAANRIQARLIAGVQKLQTGCSVDVKKFCSTVTPGEGRLFHCIMAHEDQISAKCDFTLFTAMRNLEHALDKIEQVADACGDDIEKSCSNVPEGSGRIAVCLASKKTSLSSACQAAISDLAAK
jgi:predicted enzyme related to lactoylglutathione lyase